MKALAKYTFNVTIIEELTKSYYIPQRRAAMIFSGPRDRSKPSRHNSRRSKKKKQTSSLVGRSSPDTEALTIFMPGDDVVKTGSLQEVDLVMLTN